MPGSTHIGLENGRKRESNPERVQGVTRGHDKNPDS